MVPLYTPDLRRLSEYFRYIYQGFPHLKYFIIIEYINEQLDQSNIKMFEFFSGFGDAHLQISANSLNFYRQLLIN